MSTIPVSRIVNVTVLVAAQAPQAPSFSRGLVVGSSSRLPTYDRLRTYSSLLEVADDFQASDEEYKCAQVYFGQSPRPREVMIGRRLTSASAGTLRSGTHSTTLGDFTAITAGGFDIAIDGTTYQIHGIDLHLVANAGAAVAAAVQTALQAHLASTTCTHDGTNFVITSPTTGGTSVVGYAVAPTTEGAADLSTLMGLTVAAGASRAGGAAAESITDSLNALLRVDSSWYGFHLTSEATNQNKLDASAWAEANARFHFCTTSSAPVLDGASTTDIASTLQASAYTHTFLQYSSTHDYAAASAMARALQVDFNGTNTTITLMFKQEPGVVPENLTSTQYGVLDTKKVNYLATVSNGFIQIFNGVTPSGRFFDEIMNLDWFTSDAQNELFTAMATPATKVPQTDKGAQRLVAAISNTCEKANKNGFIGQGTWANDGFGTLENGDILTKGYYVYIDPVASQSSADRSNRIAPPLTVALIGAGAFHGLNVTVNFQR